MRSVCTEMNTDYHVIHITQQLVQYTYMYTIMYTETNIIILSVDITDDQVQFFHFQNIPIRLP